MSNSICDHTNFPLIQTFILKLSIHLEYFILLAAYKILFTVEMYLQEMFYTIKN